MSVVEQPSTIKLLGPVIVGTVLSVIVNTCSQVELLQASVTLYVLVTVKGSSGLQNVPDITSW